MKYFILILIAVFPLVASAHESPGADAQSDYCDFKLFAAAEAEGEADTLLLRRADLSSLETIVEEDATRWHIEVADHALADWEAANAKHIGLSMPMYCGDELIASPVVRMPLGKQFMVTGMDKGGRRLH